MHSARFYINIYRIFINKGIHLIPEDTLHPKLTTLINPRAARREETVNTKVGHRLVILLLLAECR